MEQANQAQASNCSQLERLGISIINTFDGARDAARPKQRLEKLRQQAETFRQIMLAGPQANYAKSEPMVEAPYPTKFAYLHAVRSPMPYVLLGNHMFILQFESPTGRKNMLFGINDVLANGRTPFFAQFQQKFRFFAERFIQPKLEKTAAYLPQLLAQNGLNTQDIDYISFDHLHVQDLRKWLGDGDKSGFFPNAKLLVMRQEWESSQGLLPIQEPWYCPQGTDKVPSSRIVLLDNNVMLGDGVALIQTPGHTEGNHSLVFHINNELYVSSENGMSADSYAPLHSRIPGLRQYAQKTGSEVILNGNTLENSVDQYLSMVVEKTIAGPSKRYPGFYNVIPSSEITPKWFNAHINPSVIVGDIHFGRLLSKP